MVSETKNGKYIVVGTVYLTCKIALYRTLGGGNYKKTQEMTFYIKYVSLLVL